MLVNFLGLFLLVKNYSKTAKQMTVSEKERAKEREMGRGRETVEDQPNEYKDKLS